jgi:hypothetical protein
LPGLHVAWFDKEHITTLNFYLANLGSIVVSIPATVSILGASNEQSVNPRVSRCGLEPFS